MATFGMLGIHAAAKLGLFESAKDAARRGYSGPIADGFTDILGIGKARHRVTILKIGEER